MRINTNVSSLNAIESGTNNNIGTRNSLEKLSSGLRINKASDDASGLAIADKLRTQKNSINQSVSNANSAVAMIQIADKAMAEQSVILDVVKSKMIQAATATTSTEGRTAIAKDVDKLLEQLNSIASQTNYNGVNLLQLDSSVGSAAAVSLTFQVGEKSSNVIVTSGNVRANTNGLGLAGTKTQVGLGTISAAQAQAGLNIVDTAIDTLNTYRSDFGSTQNQIEAATRNMMTQVTNIAAAESVIRDVDFAQESASFNKYSVVGQASTYAESQANSRPADILKLLN